MGAASELQAQQQANQNMKAEKTKKKNQTKEKSHRRKKRRTKSGKRKKRKQENIRKTLIVKIKITIYFIMNIWDIIKLLIVLGVFVGIFFGNMLSVGISKNKRRLAKT